MARSRNTSHGDVWTELLGIPPGPRPPHYYDLLGVGLFESDSSKLHQAVLTQTARLRRWVLDPDTERAGRVQELLNEVNWAGTVLADPRHRDSYNRPLAAELGVDLPSVAPPAAEASRKPHSGAVDRAVVPSVPSEVRAPAAAWDALAAGRWREARGQAEDILTTEVAQGASDVVAIAQAAIGAQRRQWIALAVAALGVVAGSAILGSVVGAARAARAASGAEQRARRVAERLRTEGGPLAQDTENALRLLFPGAELSGKLQRGPAQTLAGRGNSAGASAEAAPDNAATGQAPLAVEPGAQEEVGRAAERMSLGKAARSRNWRALREALVSQGGTPPSPDELQDALMAVARSRDAGAPEMLELLLANGADATLGLHAVAFGGSAASADLLIAAGADPSAPSADIFARTPLHRAALLGHSDVAVVLIGAGAAVDAQDHYGNTALHNAVGSGESEMAKLLIEAGADVNARGQQGRTPLFAAAGRGETGMLRLLANHGADVRATDPDGYTPLHMAALNGQLAAAELLLNLGAEVDAVGRSGTTPLAWALSKLHLELADLLLERGADPNAGPVVNEASLLHRVARSGPSVALEILLRHGGDVHLTDKYGRTPLHVACENGRLEAARVLLKHGARALEADKRQRRPLDLAQEAGDQELIELLKSSVRGRGDE